MPSPLVWFRRLRSPGALLLVAAFAFALPSLTPRPAFAAPTQEEMVLAKTHYDAGVAYYNEGKFSDAVREFFESYRLSSRPELLYNIATCYDHMRQDDLAESYYKQYLQALPSAPDRDTVKAFIQEIDARRASGQPASHAAAATVATPPPGETTTPPSPGVIAPANGPSGAPAEEGFFTRYRGASIAGVTTLVLLGGATTFGLVALNYNDQLHTSDPSRTKSQTDSLLSNADNYGLVADILWGATAAGAIATGALAYIESQTPDHGTSVAVAPTPGGLAFTVGGHF